MPEVQSGLQRLLDGARPDLRKARLGLVMHPASVTSSLMIAVDALVQAGFDIVRLFGPQHGARGEKQDDMIESEDYVDALTGLPVRSLYGAVRRPTAEMLAGLDAVLVDLQDVGVRVYTFVWTMTLVMEACAEAGVRVVVLDRPNPIGGAVREGAVLDPEFASFVGRFPVPLRHGLTAGELAQWVNDRFAVGCGLDVIACGEWRRAMWFDETGLPFVLPSPNLPTLDSCAVYPGMVLLEGTNLSEGRGTTRPFELFGAPFVDPYRMVAALDGRRLPGVRFRPCHFEPVFQKYAGELCGGAQLHVFDRETFRPVQTAVAILCVMRKLVPDYFAWRDPPYEYERDRMPIDILWGGDGLRRGVDEGLGPEEILDGVEGKIERWVEGVELLY